MRCVYIRNDDRCQSTVRSQFRCLPRLLRSACRSVSRGSSLDTRQRVPQSSAEAYLKTSRKGAVRRSASVVALWSKQRLKEHAISLATAQGLLELAPHNLFAVLLYFNL
ncbi:hypothetical protein LSTR_LSTR015351 [Laodelphax striatellus]|uniref:Uncharacterized protein n=1 Tax=Laodelphax striatellus TaxID=195883 RepID=A0A482X5X7_LAOST|nr:hypothetical protein LSTR_LSTR015351 [Laodelphax striatellus]